MTIIDAIMIFPSLFIVYFVYFIVLFHFNAYFFVCFHLFFALFSLFHPLKILILTFFSKNASKKFGMLPEMIKGRHPARDAMNQLAATTRNRPATLKTGGTGS